MGVGSLRLTFRTTIGLNVSGVLADTLMPEAFEH